MRFYGLGLSRWERKKRTNLRNVYEGKYIQLVLIGYRSFEKKESENNDFGISCLTGQEKAIDHFVGKRMS